MQCRQINFFMEHDGLAELSDAIAVHVLPRFEALPHFLGLTAIKADIGTRCEVIVTSYWDDELEGSEQESKRFIEEIVRETGRNPSRKVYDTLYAQVIDSAGDFRPTGEGRSDQPHEWRSGVEDDSEDDSEVGVSVR